MKRLFFSVLAFLIGAGAFISCEDVEGLKEDVKDEARKDSAATDTAKVKFLTVAEQQGIITNSINDLANVIDFTDLSQAAQVVSGIIGRNIGTKELATILSNNPELFADTVFTSKLMEAIAMFMGDTIIVDLEPLYMSADLYVIDTVRIDSTRSIGEDGSIGVRVDTTYLTMLNLTNLTYDVNCVQLNVFVDGNKITLKANAKAGESTIRVMNEETDKTVKLPETVKITIDLNGKNIATLNGEYKSDLNILLEDDNLSYQGSKLSVKGNLNVTGYELEGNYNLDIKTGMAGQLTAKYAGNELLSVGGKVDAVFEGLDLNDTTAILIWAQDPAKLKSISLNASLAAGKVEFKGAMENPFKDEELATTLRSLMVPGATISKEKAEQAIEKLNGVINAGFYFKGYKDAQAELKLIYREKPTGAKDGDDSAIDAVGELLDGIGAYPVLVAHDEKGQEVEVSFEEYFAAIDVTNFVQVVSAKFQQAFGSLIAELEAEEDGDETLK